MPYVTNQIFNTELVEFFDRSWKLFTGGCLEIENILIKLEPSWYINCYISSLLKSQILGLVNICEWMSKNFKFSSEVVLDDVIISC